MPSAKKKCICQLCTCGRHMCPHRKKDHIVLGTEKSSAKASKQTATSQEKRKLRKQWDLQKDGQNVSLIESQGEGENITTVSTNRAVAVTVKDKGNVQHSTTIDGSTKRTVQTVQKTLAIKRPDNLKSEGTIEFTSTHQQDFNRKSMAAHEAVHSMESASAVQEASWNQMQVPKTQIIKKPDTLTLSGPLNLETTHKSEFSETIFKSKSQEESQQNGTYQRPRTSLKMSGEFQSDSSYQMAYTPKKPVDEIKIKKGTSISNLKPEGDMVFDTTSLDYNAVSTRVSQMSENTENFGALKPKAARPSSEIKISSDPISDETTAVNDFKRWNVEKNIRRKPADTLQLGDSSEVISSQSFSRSNVETSASNWEVSRPIVQKPENNIKSEGDFSFTTTHDIDYSLKKDRLSLRQSNFESLSERTERESAVTSTHEESSTMVQTTIVDNADIQDSGKFLIQNDATVADVRREDTQISTEKVDDIVGMIPKHERSDVGDTNQNVQDVTGQVNISATDNTALHQEISDTSYEVVQSNFEDRELTTHDEDQTQYLSWDQIRPKPIRPHSNLRQEGDMEFDTTNRSEFVSRSIERVKGVRPKTSTKMFEGDFDSTTMNQVMFSHEPAEKVNPIRPKGNLHVEGGNFVDETTSSREFQAWHVSRPSAIVPKSNLTQEGSMEFTTTNNAEFEEKRQEKVHPIRPTTTNKIVGGEASLTTTNQVMHPEFPIERVQKIVPQSNLRTSSGEFSSETTNRSQFQDWGIERPKPIKPSPNLKQEGSMDFTTMNKLQFEEKQSEKVSQFRPHTSSKITGDFDGTTTNQVMYAAQPSDRAHMIKPKGNIELEKGTFASSTTNKSEFQHWQQSKPEAVTPRNNLQQEGDFDFTTTNSTQYGKKTIDKVSEIRPKTNSKISGEFDSTTTNQVMFQNSPGEKSQPVRPKNNIRLDEGHFNDETTTNKEYQAWQYSKPSPIKPHSSLHQEGSIDFTTTNDTQFYGKTAARVSEIRPAASTKIIGDGEFEGTTTNQAMYATQSIDRAHMVKPKGNIELEKGTFSNSTTNKSEFQQWQLVKSEAVTPRNNLQQEGEIDFTTTNSTQYGVKPIDKVSEIRPKTNPKITGDFDSTTTNQVMFQTIPGEKSKAVRPKTNLKVEEGSFTDKTTNNQEYQTWQYSKASPIKPHSNLHQEGSMDFTTTNDTQFYGKTAEKVKGIRPSESTKIIGDGEFDGTTTTKAMFQPGPAERVQVKRPSTNIHLESGKFEDSTTARREYQEWEISRSEPIRPSGNLTQEGSMDFTTSNQTDFQQKTSSTQPVDRAHMVKPKGNIELEKGTFSNITTNKSEFQQWQLSKSEAVTPRNNLQQEGQIDFTTTNSTQYGVKPIDKVSEIRPKTNSKVTGVFDSTTTNQVMFQTIPGEKSKAVRPKTNLKVEEGTFVDKTTNNQEYQTWQYSKPSPIRPHSNLHQEGSMDFTTTNDTQFYGKTAEKVKEIRPSKSTKIIGDGDFEGTTTTKDMFQPGPAERVQVKRPSTNIHLESGKFEDSTTARREYQEWEISRSEPIRPSGNLTQEGSMDFTTSNQTDFQQKTISKVEPIKPHSSTHTTGKFDGTTTNQMMFQNQSVERVHDIRPKDNLQVDSGQFMSETTNTRDYGYKAGNKPSPIKPQSNLTQEGEFDFKTLNQLQFEGKQTSKTEQIRPKTLTKASDGKFYSTTTNQEMFQTPAMETVRGKKPSDNIQVESGEFQGQTTTNHEYQEWKVQKPKSFQLVSSLAQEGGMSFETTNKSEFKERDFERVQQVRPKTTNKLVEGDFEGTTTNKEMFQQPTKLERVKPIRHENNLRVEDGKFANETTSKREFRQWVKVEYRDEQKKKGQAAGVRSQKDTGTKETDSKSEIIHQEAHRENYQSRKSKEESVISNGKGNLIATSKVDSAPSETNKVTITESQVRSKQSESPKKPSTAVNYNVVSQDNVKFSKVMVSEDAQHASRDLSTLASDYGSKASKIQTNVPSGNLNLSGEMSFSTTSQTDFGQKSPTRVVTTTTSRNQQSSTMVQGAGGSLNRSSEKRIVAASSTPSKGKTIVPSGNLNLSGEMSFSTTSQTDFAHHSPTSRRQQSNTIVQGTSSSLNRSGDKSVAISTHTPSKVKTIVPSGNLNLSGEMSFATTSKTDFTQQSPTSRRQQVHTNMQGTSSSLHRSGEMSFTTTSQADFNRQLCASRGQQSSTPIQGKVQHSQRAAGVRSPNYESWKMAENKLISRSSTSPEQMVSTVASKVDTRTIQRGGVQMSPVKVPPKRFKPDDNLKIEPAPFEGESTSKTEFRKWETRRSSSKKRNETLKQEGKMEFDVTSNDYSLTGAYQTNKEATKAKSKADQRGSLGQSGSMEFSTTQNSSYKANVATRSQAMRPRSSLNLKMEDVSRGDASSRSNPDTPSRSCEMTSTSRASYVGHDTNRRTRAHRPTTSQKVGEGGAFVGESTSKSSFTSSSHVQTTRASKPASHNILDREGHFVGDTTYRKSFESTKNFHCPVHELEAGRSCLSFNEEKNGHLFYAPKVQG